MGVNDINSLAHSKWNCKYHIVFAPKYRRMVFYGQKKNEIGKILRKLCEWKGVEVLNAEACPDHIHMASRPRKVVRSGQAKVVSGTSRSLVTVV